MLFIEFPPRIYIQYHVSTSRNKYLYDNNRALELRGVQDIYDFSRTCALVSDKYISEAKKNRRINRYITTEIRMFKYLILKVDRKMVEIYRQR